MALLAVAGVGRPMQEAMTVGSKRSAGRPTPAPDGLVSSSRTVAPARARRGSARWIAAVATVAGLLAASAPALGQDQPGAGDENASCMGLGSSFYGQFAPQQRALVALIVNELQDVPGQYYLGFAQEKEGGTIPAPCGTRIE